MLILWATWIAYYAHYRWSSKSENVFPLFVPIQPNGEEVQFRIAEVPADIYEMMLAIESPGDHETDPNSNNNLIEELRRTIDSEPLNFGVHVTDSQRQEILRIDGDTVEWQVGERHNYSPTMRFDDFVVLYDLGEAMEFGIRSRGEYQIRVSLGTRNSAIIDHPVRLLVAGKREDGFYPVRRMLGLATAFVGLILVTVLDLLLRSRVDPKSQHTDANGA